MAFTTLIALLAIIGTSFFTGMFYERLRCSRDGRVSPDDEGFGDDPDLW